MTETTYILGDRHRQIRSPREVAEEFNREVAEENRREALEKKRRELEEKRRREQEPEKKDEAPAVPKEEKRKKEKISKDPIELSDLVLYDAKSKPFQRYDTLIIDGSYSKEKDGSYVIKAQEDWVAWANSLGKEIFSWPLLVAALEKMHETKHPGLPGFVEYFKNESYCTCSTIDYSDQKIIHHYGFPFPFARDFNLPKEHRYLDPAMETDIAWNSGLQSLFMSKNLGRSISTISEIFGNRLFLWTASAETITFEPLRTICVGIPSSLKGLHIDCHTDSHLRGRSHLLEYK